MGAPVLITGVPRTRPSVGRSAIVRTSDSPMCWATSQVIVVVVPSRVTSVVIAVKISGSWPGGNSTSTTGPITRTTLPFACPFCSAIGPLLLSRCLPECLGTADDLRDLRRDLRLALLVRDAAQHLDQLVRVVGRRLHRPAPGRALRRGGLEHRRPHFRDEVLRP